MEILAVLGVAYLAFAVVMTMKEGARDGVLASLVVGAVAVGILIGLAWLMGQVDPVPGDVGGRNERFGR